MEKRAHRRVHKYLQVQVADAHETVPGSTVDISPRGMRLRIPNSRALSADQPIKVMVTEEGRPYHLNGWVRWSSLREVDDSRFVGVSFDRTNPFFCRDILKLEVGARELPFQYDFVSKQAFLREYMHNIIFGQLFIEHLGRPPRLGRQLFIELRAPVAESAILLHGSVCEHLTAGFKLKLEDFDQDKSRLNDWMGAFV